MDANSVHQHAASAAGDGHPYAQASYFSSSSDHESFNQELFAMCEDDTAEEEVAVKDKAKVKVKVKVKPGPVKAIVQKGVEDVYYVEKKGKKYIALGGKPEPTDADDWCVLCCELGEEASITTITCV